MKDDLVVAHPYASPLPEGAETSTIWRGEAAVAAVEDGG
jgi:hypothetical protein